jgi:hypothetical protein
MLLYYNTGVNIPINYDLMVFYTLLPSLPRVRQPI